MMKRTELDAEFESVLNDCYKKLFNINQKAVKDNQPDIKHSSCYLLELIYTLLTNRGVEG